MLNPSDGSAESCLTPGFAVLEVETTGTRRNEMHIFDRSPSIACEKDGRHHHHLATASHVADRTDPQPQLRYLQSSCTFPITRARR